MQVEREEFSDTEEYKVVEKEESYSCEEFIREVTNLS